MQKQAWLSESVGPGLANGNRWIPGAYWPTSPAKMASSRFSEVSNKEEGIKGNKRLYSSDLCKSTHGGTHSCVHACVCPIPYLMFGTELHESPRKLIFSFLVSIYRPSVKRLLPTT